MSYIEIEAIDKKIKATQDELSKLNTIVDNNLRNFTQSELNHRLEQLSKNKQDILTALTKDCISIRIYGDNVEEGRVSNRILLSTLDGFQNMADSIANAIVKGATKKRGPIASFIKDITEFQVAGTFAGSFGIILEKSREQLGVHYPLNNVLDELFNILETRNNSDMLIDAIAPCGKRTVNHYKDWLSHINDNKVNIEIEWRDSKAKDRRIKILNRDSVDIISLLDLIDNIEDEDIVIKGILTGINIRNNTFELDVEGMNIIKGRSKMETLISISDSLGKEVTANLVKSTSYNKANFEKVTWYLSEIK